MVGEAQVSVAERQWRYEQLWRRRCAQTFHQTNAEDPHVDVYRYAPTWAPWSPERRFHVYITGGMADRAMPRVDGPESVRPERVELCACTRSVRFAMPDRDAVAWALGTLAHLPWREGISYMPGESVSWDTPLLDGSAMTAFLFIVPPTDADQALARAANADLVLQVMTITSDERELAVREGSSALIDRLEAAGVSALIDWDRPSCVAR